MDELKISEDGKTLIKCSEYVSGHISIPNGIAKIGDRAFERCIGLNCVEIPNSVTKIENKIITMKQ